MEGSFGDVRAFVAKFKDRNSSTTKEMVTFDSFMPTKPEEYQDFGRRIDFPEPIEIWIITSGRLRQGLIARGSRE